MNDYAFDMGGYSLAVSTESPTAQVWFDRGLNWIFGYNHEEASNCFEQALSCESACAMAHWGKAYCAGPNYNMYWEHFDPASLEQALATATTSVAEAKENLAGVSDVEKALIEALHYRHPDINPPDDLYAWSRAYAEKMRDVYNRFPNNPDVATLFAEALMNLTPWNMWDPVTGEVGDGASTLEVKQVLETAMHQVAGAGVVSHPGLLHLYIHLMEMSQTPEVALRAADDLQNLVPDAGHLKHMSTHIYVLCGDYQSVVAGNHSAIDADLKYLDQHGAMNFYSLYRVHNYHFKLYGAMFLGNYAAAMSAVQGIENTVPDEFVRIEAPPMVNFVEGYIGMRTHALVRFGKWKELTEQPLPRDPEFYCTTAALNYYGKGVAHAALGDQTAARDALIEFDRYASLVDEDRYVHVVSCQDILAVARDIMLGEIEYHAGNHEVAFEHLRAAVKKEDALPYDEPWGWMMPGRHALGALLLEQGQVQEAIETYEADLGFNDKVIRSNQHPDNVWALLGLHECYQLIGRESAARQLKPRLDIALARSDLEINASCFCSLSKCGGATNAAGIEA